MNWYIKNEDRIFDLTDMNNFGFIYIIKLKDDKFYVGKKQIKNFTYKNINKYNSSNEYIKKHIDDIISKEIIEFTTEILLIEKFTTLFKMIYG